MLVQGGSTRKLLGAMQQVGGMLGSGEGEPRRVGEGENFGKDSAEKREKGKCSNINVCGRIWVGGTGERGRLASGIVKHLAAGLGKAH